MVVRFSHFSVLAPRPSHQGHFGTRRSRRASVLVETALCLAFVLLPLTLGILQFGVIMSTANQVEQLTRDGGRWAAVHAQSTNFDSDENTSGSLKNYMKTQTAGLTTVKWSDLTITVTPSASSRAVGNPLVVTVTYPMTKKLFIGTQFPGLSRWNTNYTTKATFVMEQGLTG